MKITKSEGIVRDTGQFKASSDVVNAFYIKYLQGHPKTGIAEFALRIAEDPFRNAYFSVTL